MSKKTYNGFVIDPKARTIEPVTYETTLESWYHHTKTDIVQMVRIDEHGNELVVDEEGLLREERYFFEISTYPQPLVNRALLMGPKNVKDRVPTMDLTWLEHNVRWLGRM